jgi:hypothetical protein
MAAAARSPFRSATEFREVMDRALTVLSTDEKMGSRIHAGAIATRVELTDLSLVVNMRPADRGEDGVLVWDWTDEVDWAPATRMTMSSEVANRCLQGAETVATAMARGRIRAAGDVRGALAMLPAIQPLFERYRAMVTEEYPHLAA